MAIGELLLKIALTKGVPTLWKQRGRLSLYLKTRFGKYRKKKIRFSISYLYRIRIPDTDSYLLVFNSRMRHQLQPAGGVYKRYGDDRLFESWGYEPDGTRNGVGTDQVSSGDLRFHVRGKHVVEVIRWFEEGMSREVSANREFEEELIETGILDREVFRKITYRQLGRYSKFLQWSEHHQCYEVLIYDVVELLPTQEQRAQLTQLANTSKFVEGQYAIVTGSDIQQGRLVREEEQKATIGPHSRYTVNQ